MWYAYYQSQQLSKNRNIIFAEVEDVSYTSKSVDYFVTFNFYLSDKRITGKSSIPYNNFRDVVFLDSFLTGKKLLVLYQKDNPENCQMLFTEREYKKFHVEIPKNQIPIIAKIDSLIKAAK